MNEIGRCLDGLVVLEMMFVSVCLFCILGFVV